jgi:hypothetical protein
MRVDTGPIHFRRQHVMVTDLLIGTGVKYPWVERCIVLDMKSLPASPG